MLRAVIFDFNGIIVDDEPIHFKLFQKVFAEEGIELTKDAYYARYLGFDDRGAFSFGYREHNRPLSQEKLAELIERKAVYYQEAIRNHVAIFPGVKSWSPTWRKVCRWPSPPARCATRSKPSSPPQTLSITSRWSSAPKTSNGASRSRIFFCKRWRR